jgi:NCAIR mutase (PurE)-related protein
MIQDRETQRLLSAKAEAAFEQAAQKVIQRAKQTGTPVVVWKEGHIEEIPSTQAETAAAQGVKQLTTDN